MALVHTDETEFSAWLQSIKFVDDEGVVVPMVLQDDDSEDFDEDRTE
jgi:hypothetical protein